ncbi:MAG: hypothetical protein K2Z80_31345 [Xanthobacteraceae bacterium]|nr:hypothetical protein [Xanthobacteraceae bacterium]
MAYVKSPPPDRNTKAPRVKLSPGACDTHFHIFGPQSRVPDAKVRNLIMADNPRELFGYH